MKTLCQTLYFLLSIFVSQLTQNTLYAKEYALNGSIYLGINQFSEVTIVYSNENKMLYHINGKQNGKFYATNLILTNLPSGHYIVEVSYNGVPFHGLPNFQDLRNHFWDKDQIKLHLQKLHSSIDNKPQRSIVRYILEVQPGIKRTAIFPRMEHTWLAEDYFVTKSFDYTFIKDSDPIDIITYIDNLSENHSNPVIIDEQMYLIYKKGKYDSENNFYALSGEGYNFFDIKFFQLFDNIQDSDWYFTPISLSNNDIMEYSFLQKWSPSHQWGSFGDLSSIYHKNIDDMGKGSSFVIMPGIKSTFMDIFPKESYTWNMEIPKSKRINKHKIRSTFINGKFVYVYLPKRYKKRKKYDVIYCFDGQMYMKFPITKILDNISRRTKKEFIFVMIQVDWKYRTAEYAPDMEHLKRSFPHHYNKIISNVNVNMLPSFYTNYPINFEYHVVKEIVPFIDSNYSTKANPKGRVIMGSSFGGIKASTIAYRYPEVFGNVIAQSGFYLPLYKENKYLNSKAWISHGTFDLDWIISKNEELLNNQSLFSNTFASYKFHVYNGGHKPWLWLIDFEQAINELLE